VPDTRPARLLNGVAPKIRTGPRPGTAGMACAETGHPQLLPGHIPICHVPTFAKRWQIWATRLFMVHPDTGHRSVENC
ncbi:MAG: hypothetical protein WA532_06500, partial [Candidatus Korobacteraceae bacterium]